MAKIYDFVIIGSGPSGGALAYYLSKAGASCLLLEAGKDYPTGGYPTNELDANSQMMWNGGMDMSTDAGLLFLRGKALGGGSIINQCLLDRFDDEAFSDWKDRSGASFYSIEEMQPHYEEIESRLSLHKMQQTDWNKNAALYVDAFEKNGMQWAPLQRGQSQCDGNDCIVCLGGCNRDSKQSALVAFIRQAQELGLVIETEFEVSQVVHGSSMVSVFGRQHGQSRQVFGRRCILAAGALGSTKLMLQSGFQSSLPALGNDFNCHPQFMNLALFDEVVDAHKGAFQAVKSDDKRFRQQGFKLENVFAGPIAIALLEPGFGEEHGRFMDQYRKMACIEVAVRDATPGTIRLDSQGRLKIQKQMSDSDWQRANAGLDVVSQLFESIGAKEVVKSPIKIGLHLMGGCTLGQDANASVVNESFQVHGYPNLYIADSSTFPSAPGINPSLTIYAQSHLASQKILAECGVAHSSSSVSQTSGREQ